MNTGVSVIPTSPADVQRNTAICGFLAATPQCVENLRGSRLGESKGKVHSRAGHEGPERGRGIALLFL